MKRQFEMLNEVEVTTFDLSWNLLSDFAALLTLCQGLSSLLSLKVE